ncbi:hypothetical protein NDU88_002672 [Pleurodeles waltl]|uniref:Uncharacterized protein n=1 Tax=Pleurodeles waltl TaxID=8319 RepID=A0AAV7SEV7_PLEWA|nr:hypothetical protein NDU88_002672 [Pleurodeles waltl]
MTWRFGDVRPATLWEEWRGRGRGLEPEKVPGVAGFVKQGGGTFPSPVVCEKPAGPLGTGAHVAKTRSGLLCAAEAQRPRGEAPPMLVVAVWCGFVAHRQSLWRGLPASRCAE